MIVVSDGYIRVHNREIHDTLLRVHSTNRFYHHVFIFVMVNSRKFLELLYMWML